MKSNRWCPAGKCECKYYSVDGCHGLLYYYCGSTQIGGYEQCPWPSRQRPIAGETNCNHLLVGDFEAKLSGRARAYQNGFAAGAAEQSKRDRAAVERKMYRDGVPWGFMLNFNNGVQVALTALDAAKMEGK